MPRARTLAVSTLVTAVLVAVPAPAPAQAGSTSKMIRKINAFRASHGVPRMRSSRSLSRASVRWSRLLIARDFLAHSSARPRGFSVWGEALEFHLGGRANVGAAFRRLKNSPPHRAILLSHSFAWVGAGRATGNFQGRRATIWTIKVGRR